MNFINLKDQYNAYKDEIDLGIKKVIDNTSFIMGEDVLNVENDLSSFSGAKYVIACSSGTDAILMSLMALNVGVGDEVIVPCFSFFATAEMVSLIGAKPVFVDIEKDTYNIDHTLIEDKINEKTKAIMPVSLYGLPCEMDEINKIANKYDIPVIEDGAQSFGATYKDKRSCNLSMIGVTSFFPAKPLGCYGDGGAVFCNDESLYKKMMMIRNHGSSKRYYHEIIGLNGRFDTIQAAVIKVKLKYFQNEIETRNKKALIYDEAFKEEGIKIPFRDSKRVSAQAIYTLSIDNRDEFQKKMSSDNIPTAVHYPMGFHQLPVYKEAYRDEQYPVTEEVARRVISLPLCAFLKEDDQAKVIDAVRKNI